MWLLVITGILLLVALISLFKIQPFISFLIVSLLMGLANGLETSTLVDSVQKGIGSTLGAIVPIIVLGSMIGKIIAQSNASVVITDRMVELFGPTKLPFAFMIIGFIVGLPLFYSVAFLLMAPLVLSTAKRQNINPVYLGIPMLASLSITQGFLPPHPAPYYLVTHLPGADMGITLGLGIVISIPAMLISGWLFGKTLKNIKATPMNFASEGDSLNNPNLTSSLFVLLLPVILISIHSFSKNTFFAFVGEPIVALLLSLGSAIYLLGFKRGIQWTEMQTWLIDAIKEIAPLILTFAGAGAFKEILQAMHVGDEILLMSNNSSINPLIIAWIIAAILRIVTGSSTVAGITTAGLIIPLLVKTGINPNLLALSIGAGSMVLSHVNDTGFWLYKEYFGVSIKDSLRSWTIMETILSVVGLIGVLVLEFFI
jgi:Gnt-I system high-affinity gluconate transporter